VSVTDAARRQMLSMMAEERAILTKLDAQIDRLVSAATLARICLSETSSHHGTAVRGCKKCERARQALSAVDKAINAVEADE
jgi:hypothetical protein